MWLKHMHAKTRLSFLFLFNVFSQNIYHKTYWWLFSESGEASGRAFIIPYPRWMWEMIIAATPVIILSNNGRPVQIKHSSLDRCVRMWFSPHVPATCLRLGLWAWQSGVCCDGGRPSLGRCCVNSAVVYGGPSVTDSITEMPRLPGEGLPVHAWVKHTA